MTQLEWRGCCDCSWMGLNRKRDGEKDKEEKKMLPLHLSPVFIALKSPGLTQGLAASRVGLWASGRAWSGRPWRAAAAGQAGE